MYIIVGLGNPTNRYEGTRHNAGFEVIDALASGLGVEVSERKHKAFCKKTMIGTEKVVLAKPQTYMNLSGESVREIACFYKVGPEHIIVVYDDVSLEEGRLRIRLKGSAGGHNGIKSIISCLGTQDFPRVRVGVGEKPEDMDLADYVLSRFPKGQQDLMETAYQKAAKAVRAFVEEGPSAAMNRFNAKKEEH